jgi:Domain of unknown function (DUF4157)
MRMKRQNDSRVTHQKGDKGRPERSHPRPAVQGEAERNPVWQSLAMRSGIIQPKLTVGKVDDPYEREADRVADQVMRMPAPRSDGHGLSIAPVTSNQPQRACDQCEEEDEKLQRKESGSAAEVPATAPPIVHQTLSSPGQPIDAATRAYFEPRFGHSFADVRLHTGEEADVAARGLNARAFTVGNQIAFAAGQYTPHSEIGSRLLAHELTHVLQQHGAHTATVQRQDVRIPAPAERPQLTDKKIVMDQEASCGARAKPKAPDYAACVSHTDFVNGMATAVENLRKVPTTYGVGLAEVYGAFLDQIVRAGPSAVPRPGAPLQYTATNLTVKVSPTTSMPLASLTLEIEYEPGTINGSYEAKTITLNEHNLFRSNTEIERVMYVEGMHMLEGLVDPVAGGDAEAKKAHPELTKGWREAFREPFVAAAAPIFQGFMVANRVVDVEGKAREAVGLIYATQIQNESINRVEELIYTRLRQGLGLSETELKATPQTWLNTPHYWFASYWDSNFPGPMSFKTYLDAVEVRINTVVLPVIHQLQIEYMRLRQSGKPKTERATPGK